MNLKSLKWKPVKAFHVACWYLRTQPVCVILIPLSYHYLLLCQLKSDHHHIHQYQKNKQSPLIITELTEHKRPRHVMLESRSWHGNRNVAGLNCLLMGSQPSHPDNRISNGNTYSSQYWYSADKSCVCSYLYSATAFSWGPAGFVHQFPLSSKVPTLEKRDRDRVDQKTLES